MTDRDDRRASFGEVLRDVGRVFLAVSLTGFAVVAVTLGCVVAGLLRPKGERVDR